MTDPHVLLAAHVADGHATPDYEPAARVPAMTQPQPVDLTNAFAEMHDAVQKTVQLFIDNCPEGFEASNVAEAIVDVCSDELTDLYRARAERDQFADRVDTLTAVCKSNALAHRVAVEECERLRVERERVVELIESSTEAWLTNPSVNMRTALALLRDETAAVSDPTTTP